MGFKEKIKKLPSTPGVYLMKSGGGETLYVGKALSLRKRLSSYLSRRHSARTSILLGKVRDLEWVSCNSEEQALVLEAALIKERKPKYNISLRDDKSYPYIVITEEAFPRIFISRPKRSSAFSARKKKGREEQRGVLFGPYPDAKLLKASLKLIRRVFPYCSCKLRPKRTCLFFHLNLCPGPCEGKVSFSEYEENIVNICKILRGERKELIRGLRAKMKKLSKDSEFEEAARVRDKLFALENLYQARAEEHSLLSLKEALRLPAVPLNIEAIDISSLSGKEAAGAAVVFRDGLAAKDSYRRYRIKEVEGVDDYAMVAEVVKRRYARFRREKRKLPDLVIIDGGQGHLERAEREMRKLNLKVPMIGIAKRNEEVWLPRIRKPLIIPKDKPCLHLLQRIRDEAHRFAHAYHEMLRRKRVTE